MIDRFSGEESELVTAPLRGYRSWNMSSSRRLASVSMQYVWTSVEQTATCARTPPMFHVHRGEHVEPVYRALPAFRGEVSDDSISGEEACVCNAWEDHRIPGLYCSCGIYGWYQHYQKHLNEFRGYFSGVIEVSGRVVLGTKGFRAERAKIIACAPGNLFMDNELPPHWVNSELQYVKEVHYPEMQVFGSFHDLVDAYPPDIALLRNLGVYTHSEVMPDGV